MGLAYETLSSSVTNAGVGTLTAVTVASGDSLTVRRAAQGSKITLESIIRKGATGGQAQVLSPLLHDDSWGITVPAAAGAAAFLLPAETGQPLTDGDTLILKADSGAADSTLAGLGIYYADLAGAAARLHMWGDIGGLVKSIKAVHIAPTGSATIGAWKDTLITNDEDVLHSKSDYAVLGYLSDTAIGLVGIKGQATSNLRVAGPGPTDTLDTSDYFVRMSERHGSPHIPVFNGDDRGSVYLCIADNTASPTPKISLILAELASPLG